MVSTAPVGQVTAATAVPELALMVTVRWARMPLQRVLRAPQRAQTAVAAVRDQVRGAVRVAVLPVVAPGRAAYDAGGQRGLATELLLTLFLHEFR